MQTSSSGPQSIAVPEDAVVEGLLAQRIPNMLHRAEPGRIGSQFQQIDVGRYFQSSTTMPALAAAATWPRRCFGEHSATPYRLNLQDVIEHSPSGVDGGLLLH